MQVVHSQLVADTLRRTVERQDLAREEARSVMEEIMAGKAHEFQTAALLTALRIKGETAEEVTGFAEAIRARAGSLWERPGEPSTPPPEPLLDTCGTGGDGSGTFNVSTAAALVVAGAGLKVAKHGNRSVSSRCGSADVLEALGVNIQLGRRGVARCILEVGIGFLFAPIFHQAIKVVMPVRRELGIRTVFNILGPLTNPAGASCQVVGVYSPALTERLAGVLARLGLRRAFVVHGHPGLDEISNTGPSWVSELRAGETVTYQVSPEDFGLATADLEELRGGSAGENAEMILGLLRGEKGARRDIVLMNAAAALRAGEQVESWREGVERAAESVDSGAALSKLRELVETSRSLGERMN